MAQSCMILPYADFISFCFFLPKVLFQLQLAASPVEAPIVASLMGRWYRWQAFRVKALPDLLSGSTTAVL